MVALMIRPLKGLMIWLMIGVLIGPMLEHNGRTHDRIMIEFMIALRIGLLKRS